MTSPAADNAPESKVFFSREAMGGVPWTMVNNGVLFFVYFAASVFMVRYLGAEQFGVFSLCRSIGEFLVIVCLLGLNISLLRFIPELVVKKDKAGLRRIIRKSAWLQASATLVVAMGLYAATPWLDRGFDAEFQLLTVYTGLFIASRVMKQFVDDILTALYRVPAMAILSILQGLSRLAMVAVVLYYLPRVSVALLIQVLSVVPLALVGWWIIRRQINGYNWKSPPQSIGRRRIALLAGPRYFNSLLMKLMSKYTEQFFLGAYFGPALVGVYELAFTIPLMLITTLPLAVQKLYFAAFSEAYAKDPSSIGYLLSAFYKMLIVMILPIAVFATFFAPMIYQILYGDTETGVEAGRYAPYFVVFHTLSMVSLPIGAAMVAYEKLYWTTPMLIIQVAINLLFDFLLIPRFGMMGAIGAVYATYGITIPVRLYVANRLVGGLNFPSAFALKHLIALIAIAGPAYLLSPYLNAFTLILVAIAYGGLYLALIRYARLIRPEDVAELRALRFTKFNKALDLLVPLPQAGR